MSLSVGQILNDRYRIDALLGQGGMGAVYRAWDLNLGIPVAVKENPDTSPDAQKQFSREATMLARLSHPNLPRVTDHFFVSGQGQYLVMDYVEGEDLQSMVERLGALPEMQVSAWISQVCDALTYLHNQPAPIIHRDIKPANLKIRPDGRTMLVDFGIAKVYDPYLATTMGAKAVTPGYSPPEQYGGSATDARSDIYALGATLYHLLTGQRPPESVQRMVGTEKMPRPRQLNQRINPVTEQTILKATEVATDRRFQTVDELRSALTRSGTKVAQPARTSSPSLVTAPDKAKSLSLQRRTSSLPLLLAAGAGLVIVAALVSISIFGTAGSARATATSAVAIAPISVTVHADISKATDKPQSGSTPIASLTKVSIPAVVGQMYDQAVAMLEANNLKANIVKESAAVCAGIVTKQEPAMWTQVEAGTTVTLFGCVGPTPTPRPTSTPRPTPIPTATIDADPAMYDDFNDPNWDGRFSPLKWRAWPSYPGHMVGPGVKIEQSRGILTMSVSPQERAGGPILESNSSFLLPAFKFAQAQVMMVGDQRGGGSTFRIQAQTNIDSQAWWTECDLRSDAANSQGRAWLIISSPKGDQYITRTRVPATFDNWHLLRLEIDRDTVAIRCYLNGNLVDSYLPKDAERLKSGFYKLNIGIWTEANTNATFKVDEFRIGR